MIDPLQGHLLCKERIVDPLLIIAHFSFVSLPVLIRKLLKRLLPSFLNVLPLEADDLHNLGRTEEIEPLFNYLSEFLAEINESTLWLSWATLDLLRLLCSTKSGSLNELLLLRWNRNILLE